VGKRGLEAPTPADRRRVEILQQLRGAYSVEGADLGTPKVNSGGTRLAVLGVPVG